MKENDIVKPFGDLTPLVPETRVGVVLVDSHKPYVPSPLPVGRVTLPESKLQVGPFTLSRLEGGQLWLSDGVTGRSPDEKLLEKLLSSIVRDGLHKIFLDNPHLEQ